ncbi:MAG: hypothetical protein KA783_11410 [Chitinophagales bacterium]|nr:hypothetical protein [Chitinophagales bacterium]
MQTNNRLIALFCLGILLGAALTILVGRYTHTLYLASDYEPLLKEMEESLEMQGIIMQDFVDRSMMSFNRHTQKQNRGFDKFALASNIYSDSNNYISLSKNQISTPQQLKKLYERLLAEVPKEEIAKIIETTPFLNVLTANAQQTSAITTSSNMPIEVKRLYAKLQQLQLKILVNNLIQYWYSTVGELADMFPTREPILMPNATTLQQNDTLRLNIGFLLQQSLLMADVGKEKIFGDNDGLIRITRLCNEIGEHKIEGVVSYSGYFSEKTTYPFTQHYTVVKPCR